MGQLWGSFWPMLSYLACLGLWSLESLPGNSTSVLSGEGHFYAHILRYNLAAQPSLLAKRSVLLPGS